MQSLFPSSWSCWVTHFWYWILRKLRAEVWYAVVPARNSTAQTRKMKQCCSQYLNKPIQNPMLGNGREKQNGSLLKKYSTASWKMSSASLHICIAGEFSLSPGFCFPRISNALLSNLRISCWCDGKTGREERRLRRRSFPLSDLWLLDVPRNVTQVGRTVCSPSVFSDKPVIVAQAPRNWFSHLAPYHGSHSIFTIQTRFRDHLPPSFSLLPGKMVAL